MDRIASGDGMTGYALSARAAEAERRWALERKEIVSGYAAGMASTANRDDFATNRVTVANFRDALSLGDGNVEGLATAGACVAFWAGNIAGLPLHVLRTENGVDVPFPEHPLYWLLHDDPNFEQSSFDFWEFLVESLEWRGNAYAQISKRGDGTITSLLPLHPDTVSVTRLTSGELEYKWTLDGTAYTSGPAGMLHIRGRGGNALGGASTIGTYRRALRQALATEASADALFANGVRSSGVLKTDKPLTGEQRAVLEQLLGDKFVGAANAGRPMLLDNGLTWEKIAIDPVDAELVVSRQLGMTIICQIFECDPHLVGITAGNTQLGSSISDQTLSLVKFKMHKRLRRIEKALGKQLLTRLDRQRGVKIRFNIEGFLRADSEGRGRYYNLMKPFMTVNQVRAMEGWAPVPGGDVIYRQMQDEPLGGGGSSNTAAEDEE
ncbi:phage portal protein [Sphingomonas hankookensis]